MAFNDIARSPVFTNQIAGLTPQHYSELSPLALLLVDYTVMGGHIQAVVSSVSAAMPQAEAGNTRILAIAAPKRQTGRLANLPTMREQGINATGISGWRGVFGAKGLTAAQAAAWSEVLGKVVLTDDWKNQLEANNVASNFIAGREFAKWLAAEYEDTRAVMSDLGLAK